MILMNLKRCEGGPQLHWVAIWAVSPAGALAEACGDD